MKSYEIKVKFFKVLYEVFRNFSVVQFVKSYNFDLYANNFWISDCNDSNEIEFLYAINSFY